MPKETTKASLLCWLVLLVVWSRVLCSEVYLAGSVCEVIAACGEGPVSHPPCMREMNLNKHFKLEWRSPEKKKIRF